MSQTFKSKSPSIALYTASETSIRQLISNGKFKAALENAKDFHKSQRTPASETLLLDAYVARIQSLLDQNLALEAKALAELVRERFPAAKERLANVMAVVSARSGDLAELLQPLNDLQVNPDRRAAIDQMIQTQVTDLASIANCAALPPEHSLRKAAGALDQAFNLVTSGPVTDEQIALPEVSFRSPLSAWKILIRAIAQLHRGEDDACRASLAAIKPEVIPARLAPAMLTMLDERHGASFKPAETALVSRVTVNLSDLRNALANLDRAFDEHATGERINKAVRAAMRECSGTAPELLNTIRQITHIRGMVTGLDERELTASLGGTPRQDAEYFRMYALAMEGAGDEEDALEACEIWEDFRKQALKEGRFRPNGIEMAMLYLHMAQLAGGASSRLLYEYQRPLPGEMGRISPEDRYFFFPDKLYGRSCLIDPHVETFALWLRWAIEKSVLHAEDVARQWNKMRPQDLEPLLYLMAAAEKRKAIPTALSYLDQAERVDPVHSEVRAARLRLLAAAIVGHLQKKKPHLAAERVALMAALPQAQQGDRPAFVAAVRYVIGKMAGNEAQAGGARLEVERVLGDVLTAKLLIYGMARIGKLSLEFLPLPKQLPSNERQVVPAALARVMLLAKDLSVSKFQLPELYFKEAAEQFADVSVTLDAEHVFMLGELGLSANLRGLAWAASAEGLKRGGSSVARFLLLRAQAIPPGHGTRYIILAAAALELGRVSRETEVVDGAAEIVRNPFGGESISLTLEQARDVVGRELLSAAFPVAVSADSDYSDLLPASRGPCQCAECRRQRGESVSPLEPQDGFDDFEEAEEDELLDDADLLEVFERAGPKDMPEELKSVLFKAMKDAYKAGMSPQETMEIMESAIGIGGKKKKGRKKK